MKKFTALLLALTLMLAGCSGSDSSAGGIIGGADSSTSIIVDKQPLPSSESESEPAPESPPAVPESSSVEAKPEPAPESKVEPKPESKAESKAEAKPEAKPETKVEPEDDGKLSFTLSSDKVKAGSTLTLTGKNLPDDAGVTITSTVGGARKFFQDGTDGTAFIAVSRSANPGKQSLTVKWDGGSKEIPFEITDPGFEKESFQMDQGTVNSTVNSNSARDEYNRITAEVMALSTADSDYPDLDGFIMPLTQQTLKISSSYGFTRIVNGNVSGRHEGIDFPAPRGTPVVAAGGGRVLYSGLMQMTGNTVIIEHGMGLKSWYHHMDSLDCETGDILRAGDAVGKVGTTGYSTGNHLHFGMSVFDIYTDPWQFIPRP